MPGTLSPVDAKDTAVHCKDILLEYKIANVKIVFHESIFTRFTALQLLDHLPSIDPTAMYATHSLWHSVSRSLPKAFPYFEGTGCLYLCEGGGRNWVFLLITRHVALLPSEYPNELYNHKNNSMPHHEIIHIGSRAFQNAIKAIMDKIGHKDLMIGSYKDKLEDLWEAIECKDAKTTTN